MSFNQWRILTILKDHISKITNDKDKSLPNTTKNMLQFIQKLSPLSSKDTNFFQIFDGSSKSVSVQFNDPKKDESHLPTVLNDLKNKIGMIKESEKKSIVPKWKQKIVVSENHILLNLEHLLSSINVASSHEEILYSVEQLAHLLKQFPEIKSRAVKLGAIQIILRTRSNLKQDLIQGVLNETLALLGYADPVPKMGIRILSIDGGGIRGLLVLEMLKKLEEITGKKTYELFDFFCGVSTGAILAFSIGVHRRSLDEISKRYEAISQEVFKQSSWKGTGSLVWSHSYYDTLLWEKKLQEHLGTDTMISTARNPNCPKLCAVSAIVNQERLSAFIFRNYTLPWKVQSHYMGTSNCEIWQAARASAAAPTYFEEFKLGNYLHQDGGILVNNPTAIALHEVRLVWPHTPIQCVVSFGTGRTVPSAVELSKPLENSTATTSWTDKFFKILDSATDTEGVHIMLNDLLPDHVYYRFNPYLTEMVSMVETDSQKLEQLRRDALMYLRRNEDKFQEVAKTLMKEKSMPQKIQDVVKIKRDMWGF